MSAIPKSMLIDAIIGRGFKSMQEADHYQRVGLADFTGNQWNENGNGAALHWSNWARRCC